MTRRAHSRIAGVAHDDVQCRLPPRPRRRIQLNGRRSRTHGETILQAADRAGVAIPRLCYTEGMRPDGNCRACVVEIDGERVLAPSCCRAPKAGHEGEVRQPARRRTRRSWCWSSCCSDMPAQSYKPESELDDWARRMKVGKPRFAPRFSPGAGPVASGHRRQPRRLHPVHALRARLPRIAGQRRHRLRVPRPAIRRSCSTSATRWARARASPAANACRPAPPAR